MRNLLIVLFTFVSLGGGQAATYYVSSRHGSDGNSGDSPDHAWKTIARVNAAHLMPGDEVLFRRGDVWRETLRPLSSGKLRHRIIYGAYGSGPRPVISGSDVIPEASIFHTDDNLRYIGGVETVPAALWKGAIRMNRVDRRDQLQDESQWWCDVVSKRVYFTGNAGRNLQLQVRDVNIDNNEQSHLVYDNFDLQHAREGLRLYAWKSRVSDVVLQNSTVTTEPSAPHGAMSAGVYASVNTGSLSGITIEHNSFVPYPTGLEHWGVYFVQGISDFRISDNSFGPAGEDAITIWHSEHGVISNNSGGGNGENTVDVKDSHDVLITGNRADGDGEYNIVVHGVDSERLTYNITVEKNQCVRGGQAGHLTAGIVLLFTRDSKVKNNIVQNAYGAGVFINDKGIGSRNEISGNTLRNNGTRQNTGAITLEDVSNVEIRNNTVSGQGSSGFALKIEGGPHTRGIQVAENAFFSENGRVLDLAAPAGAELFVDKNMYYGADNAVFRWKSQDLSFVEWRAASQQDAHSRLADRPIIGRSQPSSALFR